MAFPCVNCKFILRPFQTLQLLRQSHTHHTSWMYSHSLTSAQSHLHLHLTLWKDTAVNHHCRYSTPSWPCSSANLSVFHMDTHSTLSFFACHSLFPFYYIIYHKPKYTHLKCRKYYLFYLAQHVHKGYFLAKAVSNNCFGI